MKMTIHSDLLRIQTLSSRKWARMERRLAMEFIVHRRCCRHPWNTKQVEEMPRSCDATKSSGDVLGAQSSSRCVTYSRLDAFCFVLFCFVLFCFVLHLKRRLFAPRVSFYEMFRGFLIYMAKSTRTKSWAGCHLFAVGEHPIKSWTFYRLRSPLARFAPRQVSTYLQTQHI